MSRDRTTAQYIHITKLYLYPYAFKIDRFIDLGIHATIAAVLAAFMIPADAKINESIYLKRIKKLTRRFEQEDANEVRTLEEGQVDVLTHIQHDTSIAIPLLQQLEHKLAPIVTFVIMPIFAFC